MSWNVFGDSGIVGTTSQGLSSANNVAEGTWIHPEHSQSIDLGGHYQIFYTNDSIKGLRYSVENVELVYN